MQTRLTRVFAGVFVLAAFSLLGCSSTNSPPGAGGSSGGEVTSTGGVSAGGTTANATNTGGALPSGGTSASGGESQAGSVAQGGSNTGGAVTSAAGQTTVGGSVAGGSVTGGSAARYRASPGSLGTDSAPRALRTRPSPQRGRRDGQPTPPDPARFARALVSGEEGRQVGELAVCRNHWHDRQGETLVVGIEFAVAASMSALEKSHHAAQNGS